MKRILLLLALWLSALPIWAQVADGCWTYVLRDSLEGMVDTQGKLLFPLMPYRLSYNMRGGLVIANDGKGSRNFVRDAARLNPEFLSGNTGLLDRQGQWVVPLSSHKIGYWGAGMYWICTGGQLKKYCTEPDHMEGGRYALCNASGILIDSLDDLAVTPEDGFSLLYRQGKIAVMDSTGKMRSGFEYDLALHWGESVPRKGDTLVYERPWVTALQQAGKWYALGANGDLQLLDWPTELGIEWHKAGWRERPAAWIEYYHLPFVYYPGLEGISRPRFVVPEDRRFVSCFPDNTLLSAKRLLLVQADLAKLGLQIVSRGDQNALVNLVGETVIDFGKHTFEPLKGGLVKQILIWGDSASQAESDQNEIILQCRLIHPSGKPILPMDYYDELRVLPDQGIVEARVLGKTSKYYRYSGRRFGRMFPCITDMGVATATAFVTFAGDRCQVRDRGGKKLLCLPDSLRFSNEDVQLLDGWLWYKAGGAYRARELHGPGRLGPILSDSFPTAELALLRRHPEFACAKCDLRPTQSGNWFVIQDTLWGMCDAQGNMLLPLAYRYLYDRGDLIEIEQNYLQGLADADGRVLIPAEYELAFRDDCDRFVMLKNIQGKMNVGILDSQGHWLWEFPSAK